MKVESSDYKSVVWFVWGGLDALYLAWYVMGSLRHEKIPYLTDLESTVALLGELGPAQVVMVVLSWVLQLSICVSCFLFLARRDAARWVGYSQLPLRLFFIVPSVSVLLVGVQFFPDYSPLLMVVLVIVSEVIKFWSLRKFGARHVAD
ncbi:hypothetical protein CS390_19465 [Pseudomonas sp. HLS-6]|uniref:hypothetical protein n=1 Tax=Pseudomonas sp. HLS-6 TaxID=2049589 RepID=UPI000C1A1C39|nr:hypothetical protein [Pseudomonas sp. HLS-6]ATR84552.1 hypothetical protein CS390_19465 [Pseudomonas sp. HLS-6]